MPPTATSLACATDVTIAAMDELEIGIRVLVVDARTLGTVGIAHMPQPVNPNDLLAFRDGDPWRVLGLLPTAHGAMQRVLADRVGLAVAASERAE